MNVDLKPQNVKNFYALMATFLVVCESMLVLWILESTSPYEKIIVGFCSVGLMALFLIIILKIETQHRDITTNNGNVHLEEEKINNQMEILMLDLLLKQIKKQFIEQHDLVNLQQVERFQTVLQILADPNSIDKKSQNKGDSARILTDIIKQIR